MLAQAGAVSRPVQPPAGGLAVPAAHRPLSPSQPPSLFAAQQMSGGTVLSTNWKDVAKKDFKDDVQAPDGQEVRKWEY